MNVRETAYMLGLSEATIRLWIANGKLKAYKVGGWAVRIPVSEIERLPDPIGREE
jgi:excisionase family DNA binding protein